MRRHQKSAELCCKDDVGGIGRQEWSSTEYMDPVRDNNWVG